MSVGLGPIAWVVQVGPAPVGVRDTMLLLQSLSTPPTGHCRQIHVHVYPQWRFMHMKGDSFLPVRSSDKSKTQHIF